MQSVTPLTFAQWPWFSHKPVVDTFGPWSGFALHYYAKRAIHCRGSLRLSTTWGRT